MQRIFIKVRSCALIFAAAVLTCAATARAVENRYLLATQDSWESHRGFYLDLENNGTDVPGVPAAADAKPFTTATLRLALGAADGTQWRFANITPRWEMNHEYHLRATIESGGLSLELDGKPVRGRRASR